MAEPTATPAQANDTTHPGGGQQPASPQAQPTEAKFTQADLDRIIADRLGREQAKYADYADLKKKVEEAESANKSELEKAIEKATKAELRAKEVETQTAARVIASEAKAVAAELGFSKPDKAIKLADLANAKYNADGTVSGVREALEGLAKEMPELLKGKAPPPDTGASNPARQGDAPQETREQKLQRIRGGGQGFQDWLNGASVNFVPEVNPKQS